MRFRNSMRLLMENFKQVYRLLLCRLIISMVSIAICCTFVLPEILDIWNSTQLQALFDDLKEFLKAILSLDGTELERVKTAILGKGGSLRAFLSLLSSKVLEITLVAIGCILVYLAKRIAETICYFTVGSALNDKMATYAETSFSTSLVANLGKASVYAAFYVPAIFLFDVLMVGICYLFLSILPLFAALYLSMTLVVLFQALKLTLTGRWMPAMTSDGKKFKETVFSKNKGENRQILKTYANYVVTVYLIVIVNVVAAFCTFGSALLITVPASFFFLICVQYVNYYTANGKKYFITYERIATNSDRGDREHFFDYIADEEQKTEETIDEKEE